MAGFSRIPCGPRAVVFFTLLPLLCFSFFTQALGAESCDGNELSFPEKEIFSPVCAVPTAAFAAAVAGMILFAASSGILLFLYISLSRTAGRQRAPRTPSEGEERMQDPMLFYVSHELRTPLSAVIGVAESMEQEERLPDSVKGKVRQICDFAQYALQVSDNVLEIKRFELGKQLLVSGPFSMCALLKGIEEIMNTEAVAKGITFVVRATLSHDLFVGDSVRLEQILLNLLTNAMKFTPENGRVCLSVNETVSADAYSEIRFRVIDNGIGIQRENHRRIFEAFEQVGHVSGHKPGIGLGLAICKQLVESMGGELRLESEPERGSEFYFTVRLEKSREALPGKRSPAEMKGSLTGIRILLAEDNELLADLTAQILLYQGAEVFCVESGEAAVEAFEKSEPGTTDVILMDVQMPGMGGFAAASEIRALERIDSDVPIIAMSAGIAEEESALAEALGIEVFLLKPVTAERLHEAVRGAVCRGALSAVRRIHSA